MTKREGRAFYRAAMGLVLQKGFGPEVAWYRSRLGTEVTERDFLRESAWVVLCSGFRESVVRKRFSYISLCYWDFSGAARIVDSGTDCVELAMKSIAHRPKLIALVTIAQRVAMRPFDLFWHEVRTDPIATLKSLPFIGQATAWHLAKNLGLDVAKPDRHLSALAKELNLESAFSLCDYFSDLTREPASVVDTVLWRAAAVTGSARALVQFVNCRTSR